MTSNSRRRSVVRRFPGQPGPFRLPLAWTRRLVFAGLVVGTSVLGVLMMVDILRANGLSYLEAGLLGLFAVTFSWIMIAFWSSVIGMVLMLAGLDAITLRRRAPAADRCPIVTRTALVMPVFNEDASRVAAGVEAMVQSLQARGAERHFDLHLLSDTTDDAIAAGERQAVARLQRRCGRTLRLFYRRRADNRGRKAGNIADFCQRWGAYYDYMVVLDADSLMTGEALTTLVRRMQANPRAGLIQTVPIPVRQSTFFGRFLQFAATLHSPVLATGFSFWQLDAANYWGHNAIIRVAAFTECCGLPELPGKAPLGGEVLSHDFVEAALLRRGGWHCYLCADIGGSYEEVPGNLLDYAKRDRRWTQGNLQHLKVIAAPGLHPLSRLHMGMGVLAFVASLLWLLMLALSTVDAVSRAVAPGHFFTGPYQLFPDWPIAKTGMIASLLTITIVVLVLPKALALLVALVRQRRIYGGALALCLGGAAELLFSVLIAPVMMTFHALFVTSVLMGRTVGWNPQIREGRMVPWAEAVRRTLPGTLVALVWGGLTVRYAPAFALWLTPILAGLLFAAPIVRYSSSSRLGALARCAGVFVTPSEQAPEPVLTTVAASEQAPVQATGAESRPARLPERWREMPVQSLRPPWRRPARSKPESTMMPAEERFGPLAESADPSRGSRTVGPLIRRRRDP